MNKLQYRQIEEIYNWIDKNIPNLRYYKTFRHLSERIASEVLGTINAHPAVYEEIIFYIKQYNFPLAKRKPILTDCKECHGTGIDLDIVNEETIHSGYEIGNYLCRFCLGAGKQKT